MLYDVSILTLMIIGVTGVIVYSYKMSRSHVYAVGIVLKSEATRPERASALAISEPVIADIATESQAAREPLDYLVMDYELRSSWRRGVASNKRHTVRSQGSFRRTVPSYGNPPTSSRRFAGGEQALWKCPKCHFSQAVGKDLSCEQCSYVPKQVPAKESDNPAELRLEETKLQTQVAQHDRTLQDFEERLRRLEKDSVVREIDERQAAASEPSNWLQ